MSTNARSESNSRQGGGWRFGSTAALIAAGVCALAAVPAPAGASSLSAETPVATVGVTTAAPSSASASATLSVADLNGKAAELLNRLPVPQLAEVLGVTPAQLTILINGRDLGSTPVEEAIAPLVAAATQTPEQLRALIAAVLRDLTEDGAIEELAHELGVPAAALEGAQFAGATAEQAARTLDTSLSGLSSLLGGAGAITNPLAATTPIVTSSLERIATGGAGSSERISERSASVLLGTPAGNGGVTLTTVTPTGSTKGVAGFKVGSPASASNAFSILSIKVTRSGAILETVRLPGPGRVSVLASALKSRARGSHAHARARARRVRVASAAKATKGGTLTLTLRPRGLSRARRSRITLATTYAPTGGSPRTLTRFVTVGRRGSRRHG